LPEKTQIRTKYFGEVKTAIIENESIIWNDQIYASFAQLSNAMRGDKMTNAWRELEIKRPTDQIWFSAQSIRR